MDAEQACDSCKMELREEVVWFSRKMETMLRREDVLWSRKKFHDLILVLFENAVILMRDAEVFSRSMYEPSDIIRDVIINKCASIANYSMMIADKVKRTKFAIKIE